MTATPVLEVDVAAVDRNLAAAAAHGVRIRPHFKAHKCLTLLRRQLAAPGHAGVTCATAAEALVVARAGIGDVLVANEVIDPAAVAELAAAAALADVLVAVDSAEGLRRVRDLPVGVLVDIDVGQARCGLPAGDPEIPALARAAGPAFRGLMGYDGHAQHDDAAGRAASTAHTAAVLREERARLEAAGLTVAIVSGGGSGTLADAAAAGVLTEVQAGSYVLMDGHYGAVGIGYEPALRCVTTVVSRHGDRAVLDAGLKHLSGESGLPGCDRPATVVTGIADEHTTLGLRPGDPLAVGDRVALVPRHLDPTMNLHDAVLADGEVWPVEGRLSSAARARAAGPAGGGRTPGPASR